MGVGMLFVSRTAISEVSSSGRLGLQSHTRSAIRTGIATLVGDLCGLACHCTPAHAGLHFPNRPAIMPMIVATVAITPASFASSCQSLRDMITSVR